MGRVRRLSLDHITASDALPAELVELASRYDCAGICLFLNSMSVLPAMPEFDLVRDKADRRAVRDALRDTGVRVDLIYPFTLTGRTVVSDFSALLEAGADLGAPLANILCYDRDPARRQENLAHLAELAASFDIGLAIEFYPPSQIRTLAEALTLIDTLALNSVGVTADLLHVMRGGDVKASLDLLSDPRVRVAQISDGPPEIAFGQMEWEAGLQRILPGQGSFDICGFLGALGPDVPVSVEVPQQAALEGGRSAADRISAAVEASRTVMAANA